MTTNHPTSEELFDAHLKQIEGVRGREIHGHLEQCAECRQVLMDYERLESLYQGTALENPPPKSLEAIRLKARQAVEKPSRRLLWTFLRLDRVVGVAVIFAIVAGIGILYRNHFQEQEIIQTPTAEKIMDKTKESKPKKLETAPPSEEAKKLPEAKKEEVPQPPLPPQAAAPTVFESKGTIGANQIPGGEAPQKMKAENAEPITDKGQETTNMAQRTVAIQPALTKTPSLSPSDRLFDQALELQNKGNPREAAKIYQKIWKDEPRFSRREALLFNWASCLEKLGKKNEALGKLELLEKINRSYPGLSEAKQRLK